MSRVRCSQDWVQHGTTRREKSFAKSFSATNDKLKFIEHDAATGQLIFWHKELTALGINEKSFPAYPVGLGFNPTPDKIKEGDGATPEGEFYIFTKNDKSAFYLSLGISYPNVEDAINQGAGGHGGPPLQIEENDLLLRQTIMHYQR